MTNGNLQETVENEILPDNSQTEASVSEKIEPTRNISNPNNAGRWVYMDVCKIVAFVFIVFTNIVAGVWGSVEIGSTAWKVLNIYNGLSRFSVPLFFLILGALLLNPLKELSVKEIY